MARHDALTGLPNRRVFSAELQAALGRAEGGHQTYSVMLIDLDRFKGGGSDLQGHAAGDVVLCEVARRLKEVVRANDTVARLGGDEYRDYPGGEPRCRRIRREQKAWPPNCSPPSETRSWLVNTASRSEQHRARNVSG